MLVDHENLWNQISAYILSSEDFVESYKRMEGLYMKSIYIAIYINCNSTHTYVVPAYM